MNTLYSQRRFGCHSTFNTCNTFNTFNTSRHNVISSATNSKRNNDKSEKSDNGSVKQWQSIISSTTKHNPIMHMLTIDSSPIGVDNGLNHYIIGFGNIKMARKVQYDLMMPMTQGKELMLLPGLSPIRIAHENEIIVLDKDATLFVAKKGEGLQEKGQDNVMDYGMCLDRMDENDFINVPFDGIYGILMPTHLLDETPEEMTFRCITIDAI